jgi:hypothetical protein
MDNFKIQKKKKKLHTPRILKVICGDPNTSQLKKAKLSHYWPGEALRAPGGRGPKISKQ